MACQDWANTKAAYRFFSNPRVTDKAILFGHLQATKVRCAVVNKGALLILHDICEFSFRRGYKRDLGLLRKWVAERNPGGNPLLFALHGFLMHSSLVLTPQGLPLGLAAVKFWERKQFKGCDAMTRKINPTRVPIEEKESCRWLENMKGSTELVGRAAACVPIGDREANIYELFCLAQDMGTRFLVRTCVDRLAQESVMKQCPWAGYHTVQGRTNEGRMYEAKLRLRYQKMVVQPPIGKGRRYKPQELTVFQAWNARSPRGGSRSCGNSLRTCPLNRWKTRSRSCNGMRCAGRSNYSTRSSNRAAKPKSRC